MLSDQELIDGLRSGLATLHPRSDLIDRLRERAAAGQPRDLPSRSPHRPRWLPPSARWSRWPLRQSRWLSAAARWCSSAAITPRVYAPPLHRSSCRRTRRTARGELPTTPSDRAGRRAPQVHAPVRPRRATRGRPREHTAPRSTGRADADSETGSRGVALRPGSAPMPSWSWRRSPRHRSARQARHSRPRRTSSRTGHRPPPPGPDGDQMVYSTHRKMPWPQRARVLTAAALLSAVLVAGCGGSSHSPSVATVGDATSSASTVASAATTSARSTTSTRAATSSGPSSASSGSGALAFASCMRANGVPNFQTRSPEVESSSKYLPEPIPTRPRSRRRGRSARTS